MKYAQFSDLCVAEIMEKWPATIGVFIDYELHCIGCPIGVFHTLTDAAEEHGLSLDALSREIGLAIEGETREGPERVRRRSAAAGGGPSPAISAAHPPQGQRSPKR